MTTYYSPVSFLACLQRQLHRKRRALADHAFHPNTPVVLLDDLPADAESQAGAAVAVFVGLLGREERLENHAQLLGRDADARDRKSTRLNSSHVAISYAVFCLKKKKQTNDITENERRERTRL